MRTTTSYQTANLVAASLDIPKNKYAISFQSRLGRSEWIKPYTAARLTELPGEGVKKLLVVCPAFVSDCLETLEEIAMQGKESFISSGGISLTLIPCLNIHPLWVKTIASWITQFRENNLQMALTK
jgi:ferrochelatase